jgi:hypothetical protein
MAASSGLGVAEADGNRTRQAEILGLLGVEDRGDHQEPGRLHDATNLAATVEA